MTQFIHLPLELMATIFSRVDTDSLLTSRLVCSDWKQILDNFFFKCKVLLTNQSMRSVRNSELNVETLQVRNFMRDVSQFKSLKVVKGGKRFPDNQLRLHPKKLIFMRKSSRNLTHASVTSENIIELLRLNPNIEFLFFDYNTLALTNLAGIENTKYQYLNQLKVCINSSADERQNLAHLAKIKLAALSTLQIFGRFQTTPQDCAEVYVCFYQIVANHKETLQVLNLVHPICTRRDSIEPSPILSLSSAEIKLLHQDLSLVQLTGLYINFDQNEGIIPEFDLGIRVLQNQKGLINLHVAFRENVQVELCRVEEILRNNCVSLLCIDLIVSKRGTSLVNLPNLGVIDSLGSCQRLNTLRLVNFKIPRYSNCYYFYLPPSLVTLMLWGQLGGIQLLEKVEKLPQLGRLDFYDTDGNQVGNRFLEHNLLRILGGRTVKHIYWHKRNFNLSFLKSLDGIMIQPFTISTLWSWPLKKSILTESFLITNTRIINTKNVTKNTCTSSVG